MIQSNELRIGNLVEYYSETFIVNGLSNNDITVELYGNPSNASRTANEEFKYIPLTEDWMKLLSGSESGYLTISSLERTSESSDIIVLSTVEGYVHEEGFLRVCAYEYDKQEDGSTNISGDVITLGYRHITFIHQLQNLYFDLSGKELLLPTSLKAT